MGSEPAVVDGEHRARKSGRLFAKKIFQQPKQWKLIGTHPSDQIEIYDEILPAGAASALNGARSVRALRRLEGSIEEVEEILSATHRSQLLAKVLPDMFASGGCIADYGLVKHATNEREHVNLQFAMFHPHFARLADGAKSTKKEALDHHLFLEYALATQLQRTQVTQLPDGSSKTTTKPVPSLLYVLRPVIVPSFSDRHAEFEPHMLAKDQLCVTCIVQQEAPGQLSLEVVLTCSLAELEHLAAVRASNTSEMWRIIVALTRLQPLLDSARQAEEAQRRRTAPIMRGTVGRVEPPSARSTEILHPRSSPTVGTPTAAAPVADRSSTRLKVKELFSKDRSRKLSSASTHSESEDEDADPTMNDSCKVCRKRFHAFRWKKRCEVCLRGVCDGCLSTIANPSAMRKKKRVCAACLYGGTNSGFERMTGAADFAADADRATAAVRATRARTTDANLSAPTGTTTRSSRRFTTTAAPQSRRRAQTQAAAPSSSTTTRQPAPRPPTTTATVPSPPTPTAVASSWASEEAAEETKAADEIKGLETTPGDDLENPYKSNSFFDETDPSGIVSDDEYTKATVVTRARRAQTIEIGDAAIKRIERKKNASRMTTASTSSSSSSMSERPRRRSFSNDRSVAARFDFSDFTLSKAPTTTTTTTTTSTVSAPTKIRSTMQFRQLKTPAIVYDLDFDWLHPFPKAPIPRGQAETDRVELMATQLKLNAHTAMVYLRRDAVLEELTQNVVANLASQWDGCSIHLIGARQVFCLAYSYQEPLPVEVAAIDVVTDDVVAREESASSYALYHQSAFFVPKLSQDVRFMAHPIHTEAKVASFLSLPIYAAGSRSCIGTMDLWCLNPSGVSSHVSHDWWSKMEGVLHQVAAQIRELSLAHAGHTTPSASFQKPRTHKARSVGSSGSTRTADSFEMDLRDLMEEHVLVDDDELASRPPPVALIDNEDSDVEYELDTDNGWTSSPADKSSTAITAVAIASSFSSNSSARPRRHTVADQYDYSSRLSRGSNASASSDFESTIESLLYQAKRTSEIMREQTHGRGPC